VDVRFQQVHSAGSLPLPTSVATSGSTCKQSTVARFPELQRGSGGEDSREVPVESLPPLSQTK
jgi:hypothetical protein